MVSNMHKISSSNLNSLFLKNKEKNVSGAAFTVKSKRTGKEYTFKIAQKAFKGFSYLHVSVERQYLNFMYLGYYRLGKLFKKDRDLNKTVETNTESAKAVSWLLKMIDSNKFQTIDENVEIYHLGSCLKCGKTLTDTYSMETGFGPVCRKS
jgi:hypothetical protein